MIFEIIRAFLLIFISEIGDKTQIIAMTFATKFKVKDVLLGVILGVVLNHGLAILLGRIILNFIPLTYIQLISGVVFLVFGFLSLQEDENEERLNNKNYGPIATVAIAFFLGELGDKTQLMAMTLATDAKFPILILIGTTLGMVGTSALGIFVGTKIGGKIPDIYIRITSSIVFIIFGAIKIFKNLSIPYSMAIIILAILFEIILIIRFINNRRLTENASIQIAVDALYKQTQEIKDAIDSICLGTNNCGECEGGNCLLGYIKIILNEARNKEQYNLNSFKLIDDLKQKKYDENKVINALAIIIYDSYNNQWPSDDDFVINKIANYLEEYLLGVTIKSKLGSKDYFKEVRLINDKYALKLEMILEGLKKSS